MGVQLLKAGTGIASFQTTRTATLAAAATLVRPSRSFASVPQARASLSLSNSPQGTTGFGLPRMSGGGKGRRGVAAMVYSENSVQKSEEEWRAILSPEQFYILRQKGTEYPGTGEYNKFYEEGVYNCTGCGTPLYKSTTKFDSGCGWPAFYEGLPGAIKRTPDPDGRRIEITCAACGAIWVTSLKVKASQRPRMSATA